MFQNFISNSRRLIIIFDCILYNEIILIEYILEIDI